MQANSKKKKKSGPSDVDVKIGQIFRTARLNAGMTQTEMARKLRTSANHIRSLESGRQQIHLFEAILYAHCIRVPAGDLYRKVLDVTENDQE